MDTKRPANDTERVLRLARSKIEQLVHQGVSQAAVAVLSENPQLASDADSAIELIYAEYLALETMGQVPDSDQWLSQFPEHRPRLERLLKLHSLLSEEESHSLKNSVPELPGDGLLNDQPTGTQPFANYELLGELGRGGMGIVYRARQKGLGRTVAIKVLRSIDHHPKVLERFQREAETVASLQHPNIVQVIEISLEPGKEFLSMEHLGGGSLESKINESNWSNHEIAALISTLAKAVHHAHEQGIIHRDLKPANIIFTLDQIPKIVDFGLAKRLHNDSQKTLSGALLGTPCYMSPEQAGSSDSNVGISTDIYSLGVVLYQLITKRLPFEGGSAMETLQWIAERQVQPPSSLCMGVPRDLETICLKCLSKAPKDRYLSAKELAEDLDRFLEHLPILARRANWLERSIRQIQRHPQVAAWAATIGLVSLGAMAVFYYQNRTVDQLARENAQHQKSEAALRQRALQAETAYEANLRKARESVQEWTQLGLTLDNDPGMDGLRRKAFENAIAYYQECMAAEQVDDSIRLEAAGAAIRAAYFHAELGEYETAESELLDADRWLKPLPLNDRVRWSQAEIQIVLANILRRMDRWEESKQAYTHAIDIGRGLLATDPGNANYHIRQSNALVNLCVVLKYHGKWDESLVAYFQAIFLSTKAATLRAKQAIPDFLANDRDIDLSRVAEALDEVTRYLSDLCERLGKEQPALLASLAKENFMSEIALCLDDVGQVFETRSQVVLAEKSYREAIRLRKLAYSLNNQNRRVELFVARSETNLGKMLYTNERIEESRQCLDAADAIYSRLVDDFPERTDYRSEWCICLITQAMCSHSDRQHQDAVKQSENAVKQLEYVYQRSKAGTIQDSLARCIFAHAFYLRHAGEETGAKNEYLRGLSVADERPGPLNSHAWMLGLDSQLTEQDKDVALEFSSQATLRAPQLGYLWNTRALVLARAGKWDECLEAIERSIALENGGGPSDWYIKSMALAGKGDIETSRSWFTKAESIRASSHHNDPELRRQAKLASDLIYQR